MVGGRSVGLLPAKRICPHPPAVATAGGNYYKGLLVGSIAVGYSNSKPKTNMAEFQNQTPLSNQPSFITGGPGPKQGLFYRIREFLWPYGASRGRKIAVVAIGSGIFLLIALTVSLVLLQNSQKTPPGTTPTPSNGQTPSPSPGSTPPAESTPTPSESSPQSSPTPSAGSQDQGSTGGGSNEGSTGGGNNGGGNGDGGGGGSTGSCPLPAYPKASCTGVPAGISLTTHSGDFSTSADNQVISGMRITGDVAIDHTNVTIRNSEIYGHIKNFNGGGTFTVEDSLVGPPSGCTTDAAIGNHSYTVNRVHLRGYAEGFRVEDAGDVTVRNSYVKFCNPNVDNHGDAIQGYLAGSNVIFEHNTVDMLDIPVATDFITAVIFWSDSSGNNVTFKDNLISGGSYSIRIHVGTGHTVTGNKVINNSWLYGPVSSSCSNITWNNNAIVEIDSNYNITNTVSQLNCAE